MDKKSTGFEYFKKRYYSDKTDEEIEKILMDANIDTNSDHISDLWVRIERVEKAVSFIHGAMEMFKLTIQEFQEVSKKVDSGDMYDQISLDDESIKLEVIEGGNDE